MENVQVITPFIKSKFLNMLMNNVKNVKDVSDQKNRREVTDVCNHRLKERNKDKVKDVDKGIAKDKNEV